MERSYNRVRLAEYSDGGNRRAGCHPDPTISWSVTGQGPPPKPTMEVTLGSVVLSVFIRGYAHFFFPLREERELGFQVVEALIQL